MNERTDAWHTFTNWIDHNRYGAAWWALTVILAVGLFLTFGCESKTRALTGDGDVTRVEFERQVARIAADRASERAEIESRISVYNAAVAADQTAADIGCADLERQDEFRAALWQLASSTATDAATGVPISPLGLVVSLIGLGGAAYGARNYAIAADKKRADAVILQLKAVANASKTKSGSGTTEST